MSTRDGTLSDFIMKTEWQAFGPMINYRVELQRQGVPVGDYYERAARCFECDERIKDDELAEIRNIPMTADEELECFDGIVCPLDYLEYTEYIVIRHAGGWCPCVQRPPGLMNDRLSPTE
jgi:hypothetical protein